MIEKDPARRLKNNIAQLNMHTLKENPTSMSMPEPTDIIRNSPAEQALEEMHPTLRMEHASSRDTPFNPKSTVTQSTDRASAVQHKDIRMEDPQEFLIKRCRGLEAALDGISRLPKRQID